MTISPQELINKVHLAIQDTANKPVDLNDNTCLLQDLDFDSLRIATLAVCLENHLGQTILLNDWVSQAENPELLTVGSLTEFVSNKLVE